MICAHPVILILHDGLVGAEGAGHQSLQALKNSKRINKPSRKRADYHFHTRCSHPRQTSSVVKPLFIFYGSGSAFWKVTVPVPTFAQLGSGFVLRP